MTSSSSAGSATPTSWLSTFFGRLGKQILQQAETPTLSGGGNGLASVAPGTGSTQSGAGLPSGFLSSLINLPDLALGAMGILLIAAGVWSLTRG